MNKIGTIKVEEFIIQITSSGYSTTVLTNYGNIYYINGLQEYNQWTKLKEIPFEELNRKSDGN